MKKRSILTAAGIIFFCHIIIAGAAIENGTLNLNLDNKTPLLYNAKTIQITIVNVEKNPENIVWENEETLPFNRSFSLYPGIYKIYVQKSNSTVIEFNDDASGYVVASKSRVDIPDIQQLPIQTNYYNINYYNSNSKDILSDIPWRINKGEEIPVTYLIKDAAAWSAKIRNITISDDGAPERNEAGDALKLTRTMGQSFTEYYWFDNDTFQPSLFNQTNNSIDIHVKFDIDDNFDVHNFYTTYISPFDLPYLENWTYGDTHFHSYFTENFMEFGVPVQSAGIAGKAIGLNWVTITDHSFDLDENKWKYLANDSRTYSTGDFKILPSEEISCKIPGGIYQKYNHYLAYGINQFIPGGEWEDGTGSHYNCDELVTIVNAQGGFGYAAHPIDSDEFRGSWYNYSLNLSGLQIWNGVNNIDGLEKGLNKWKELLLDGKKIFIEAGSDAHGDINSGFGKVRTVVLTPDGSNDVILSALKYGHSIITDGPVLVFDINKTIIGDTMEVPPGNRIDLNIRWNSTPEFGYISNITLIKGIIKGTEIIEQEIHPDSYSGAEQISLTPAQDSYFRLSAATSEGHRVYTNPIWIMLPAQEIIVGSNLNDDPVNRTWNTIQKGIDNAGAGDVIYVRNGIYHENIIINKTLTLIGEDNGRTIIDGSDRGNAVYLAANNVTISGFKILNASAYPYAGITLNASNSNKIYNNFFNNTNNFNIYNSISSAWNTTRKPGINIIRGPYLGGNFWANPDGTGFSQTCRDMNGDGICDSIYFLDSSNMDHFPLTKFTKAKIRVISPNGGENWTAGTANTIKWKYRGNPGSIVKIELMAGNQKIGTIGANVSTGIKGKGSYNWSIDPAQTPGTNYKIRIKSRSNPAYRDKSDMNFTILSPLTE